MIEYDADGDGDLFLCGLVFRDADPVTGASDQAIFLSRMSAGANNFQNASMVETVAAEDFRDLDKPWCTTGETSDSVDAVYVVYSDYDRGVDVSTIMFKYKHSVGGAFEGPFLVTDLSGPTDPAWPQVAVGIDNKVNFVWVDDDSGLGPNATTDIKFDQCTVTVNPPSVVCGQDKTVANNIVKPPDLLSGSDFLMSWFPNIAIDNHPGGPGFIHVVWNAVNPQNGDTDIYYSRSDHQNINFSTPIPIVASTQDDFFPALSIDEAHFLRLVYLSRTSSTTDTFNVFEVISGDVGNTWSAATQINDQGPIDPPDGETFIGDYIGIAATHVGWMDSRAGDFDAFSALVAGC